MEKIIAANAIKIAIKGAKIAKMVIIVAKIISKVVIIKFIIPPVVSVEPALTLTIAVFISADISPPHIAASVHFKYGDMSVIKEALRMVPHITETGRLIVSSKLSSHGM